MRHQYKTTLLCSDIVQLEWLDGDGRSRRSLAILEEIQPSGARLLIDADPPPHRSGKVRLSPCGYSGKTRRCTASPAGYYLDIAFDKGVRWRAGDYQPAHAFSPPYSLRNESAPAMPRAPAPV